MTPASRSTTRALVAVLCVLALVAVPACGAPASSTRQEVSSTSTTVSGATTTTGGPTSPTSTTLLASVGGPEVPPPVRPLSPQSVKTKYTDLPYVGLSPFQRLDIYLPDSGRRPFPVIMQIHGGEFAIGDKTDMQLNPVLSALSRGYAVVAINYRLSGVAKFPAAVYDAKAAVRYIRANASKYGLDPTRIAAWGDSAGGYLAAMLGTSGGVAAFESKGLGNANESSDVQAVVDWFGPIDLGRMEAQRKAVGGSPAATDGAANSWESRFIGRAVGLSPDLVKAADPATYITGDDPPFLIEHGTADRLVPIQQSEDLAAALSKVLGSDKVTLTLLQGARHGDPQFNTAQNLSLVLDWLDAHLK